MEKFKRIVKKVCFLPPIWTVIISIPAYALMIYSLAMQINSPVAYLSYVASAYALIITCTLLSRIGDYVRTARKHIDRHPFVKKLLEIPLVQRYFQDVRFRTRVSLYMGLFINLLYIGMKLFSGICYRSFWFVSLAVYYLLLAVMRLLLVRREKRKSGRTPMEEEIHRYHLCGIILLVMNQALMGIVVYIVQQNRGFHYPGLLIYAMAAYSFYTIIIAIINLVKYRKHGSPILSAAKAINLVAAMVSILSLTTAMISQFGGDDEIFRAVMTSAVGGGVCTIVIAMAIFMIWKSAKQMKELKINNSQT